MTNTDPLMATLRQLAGGNATSRAASQSATNAKDNKGKVEDTKGKVDQFRDQLRLLAQGAKHAPRPDIKGAETDLTQGPEVADNVAELVDEGKTKSKDRARPTENSQHRAAGETTLLSADWRASEAALSSVMSKLDHARALSPADDDATLPAAQPQTHVEQRALKHDEPTKGSKAGALSEPRFASSIGAAGTRTAPAVKVAVHEQETHFEPVATAAAQPGPNSGEGALTDMHQTKDTKADALSEPRFASSIGAAGTRTAPAVKVAVHEQETHFEPVPQLTLLQKIVDRIAPDLPTAAAQPGPNSGEGALTDMHQTKDTPLRMLTLQLDPPNMGTVTVRMRLTGDAVEVRLSADRQETAQLLRAERGVLVDAMQSAGYSFDIASIDHSRTDANPNAGQSHTHSDQPQSQQPQGGSQFNNGTSERQSNDTQAGTRQNRQGHDQLTNPAERHQDEKTVLDGNAGTLYL